jgi:hypothetical protein
MQKPALIIGASIRYLSSFWFLKLLNAEMKEKIANTDAIKMDIGKTWVIDVAFSIWARISALSLKSQKIRTSYEMGWLERN